jgi:Family of unknown function (DUF5690)
MKDASSEEDAADSPGRTLSLSAWCVVAAFGTYFCMYAFRKPFTAGSFAELSLGGVGFKSILVTAQVLGYTLSKFIGIKVVSEVEPRRRAILLLMLVGIAEVALLLFAVTPAPFNALWLFCNGIPLGMVFGLVLGFLEGRQQTEALAAGLCASFIMADGVTKSVGARLLEAGVTESWMPFTAGLLFVPPLLAFVWLLAQIPAPSRRDIAARSERTPMSGAERRAFFLRYAPGLTLLVLVFLLITILRSVRADFAPEIWAGLQATVHPDVYAWSETAVAAGILLLNGSVIFIKDNRRAFFSGLGVALAGAVLVGVALLGLRSGGLSSFAFMVVVGLGLYMPYIAVHTTIFERLIAMTRDRGNIGYLMYVADAFGYLGYVGVLLARNWLTPKEELASKEEFLSFFVALSWIIAGACVVFLLPCWGYFATHPATRPASALPGPPGGEAVEVERTAS